MSALLLTLVLTASSPGVSAEPAGAEAFRVPACSTAATAGWTRVSNPWLAYSTPKTWGVMDRLSGWEPTASTSSFRRLVVDLEASLKGGAKPTLSMFGMVVPGTAPASGAWLKESLAHSAERGDSVLGTAGTVTVPGRGECALGVVERNARRQCPGSTEQMCRRAALHLDCGTKGGVQMLVTALTPAYPLRGAPDGKAAALLAEIKSFFCSLESKGR